MDDWRRVLAFSIVLGLGVATISTLHAESAPPASPEDSIVAADTPGRAGPVANTATTTAVVATITAAHTATAPPDLETMIGDMYFAWFDGVYRRDMATIETVAGADTVIRWAESAFDSLEFTAAPTRDAISVTVKRVLLDRSDCLVVSADVDFRSFIDADIHSTVDVYFPVGSGWGFASKYLYERELWLVDCDHLARR